MLSERLTAGSTSCLGVGSPGRVPASCREPRPRGRSSSRPPGAFLARGSKGYLGKSPKPWRGATRNFGGSQWREAVTTAENFLSCLPNALGIRRPDGLRRRGQARFAQPAAPRPRTREGREGLYDGMARTAGPGRPARAFPVRPRRLSSASLLRCRSGGIGRRRGLKILRA